MRDKEEETQGRRVQEIKRKREREREKEREKEKKKRGVQGWKECSQIMSVRNEV